ncbi:E3 ubiquitin-protein ligase TRIM7-like isoform X2 [Sphaerodactylus townsendi]|nr:E3 ubiquitin-protein ligase TRIM7-like isoform X2 [Sphaerodactylus townsendi]
MVGFPGSTAAQTRKTHHNLENHFRERKLPVFAGKQQKRKWTLQLPHPAAEAAMATGGPVQELCEELTCPICLEYFKDPVMLTECGHNFCKACLPRRWEESVQEISCPECRGAIQPRNIKPNRQLANVVEIAKKLSPQGGREEEAAKKAPNLQEGKPRTCEKHQEALKLFCQGDQALICVVCDRSKEHRYHDVIPVEEAAQKYKSMLYGYIEIQRKERKKIMACKADRDKQSQDQLKRTQSARKKSVTQFRKLHQFLEEQEQLLLTKIEEAEKEIAREREDYLARLAAQLSSVEMVIQEMEEMAVQPATEFLQDVKGSLEWYAEIEEFGDSFTPNLGLMGRIDKFDHITCFLEANLPQFKDTLASELQLQKAGGSWERMNKRGVARPLVDVDVTLDPDTAHPLLLLSEDRKSMKLRKEPLCLPNNPRRFDKETMVLGREGFRSGLRFWEVTVGCEGCWAVGVARESVRRKGAITICPGQGIWALAKLGEAYLPLSDAQAHFLNLERKLKRIQVCLNYKLKRVDFYDLDTEELLYTFSDAFFCDEMLFPFFWIFQNGNLSLA